jgi:hypothetical protein
MAVYNRDPLQVNNKDDWDSYRGDLGLTKGQSPGPVLSIRAATDWLETKFYHENTQGQAGPFRGYQKAITDYNSLDGDPNYFQKVDRYYQMLKKLER